MIFIQNFEKVATLRDGKDRDYLFNCDNHFFPLSVNLKASEKLVIFFPGAFDLKLDMPKFQRKSYFNDLPYNMVSLFDPTLMMHQNLSIGWFQGNKNIDLFSLLYTVLDQLIKSLNIDNNNIIFFATSAGGIPALKLATKFKGSNVYLGNIQTNALKYYKNAVDKMLDCCYSDVVDLDIYKEKMSILSECGDINVYYAQNIADTLHYNEHYLPFIDTCKKNFSRFEYIDYNDQESGHNPISKSVELNIIDSIFNSASIKPAYHDFLDDVKLDKNICKISPLFSSFKNKLKAEVVVFEGNKQINSRSLSYACYLLYGNVVIDKKMYQKSNIFEFVLKKPIDAEISIRCYVMDSRKVVMINSFTVNPEIYGNYKDFFILGSCVSRDTFLPSYEDIGSSGYYPRTSFARLALQPVEVIPELELLSSPFQRKIVKQDMKLDVLSSLKNTVYDYILIDLIDERYGLVKYQNTFITYSFEVRNSGILGDNSKVERIEAGSDEFYSLWESGFKIFVEYCSQNNLLEKVRINEVYWASALEDNSPIPNYDLERIKYNNLILKKLYAIIKKYLPEASFIKYSENCFLSKKEHKWGITPFHYIDSLYEHTYAELKSLK